MAVAEMTLYEDLAALHGQMLTAASALAWDDLVRLESRSAEITRQLAAQAAISGSPADRRRKAELIQDILAKQGEIREAVTAWRDDVEPLLKALAPGKPGA